MTIAEIYEAAKAVGAENLPLVVSYICEDGYFGFVYKQVDSVKLDDDKVGVIMFDDYMSKHPKDAQEIIKILEAK